MDIECKITFDMTDIKRVPFYSDLVSTYPDLNISEYCDSRKLFLHLVLNNKISDEEIIDYIKFINFTSLPISSYEKVIKYINVNNIHKFIDLFSNYDIRDNLVPLLPLRVILKILNHSNIVSIKDKLLPILHKVLTTYNNEFYNDYDIHYNFCSNHKIFNTQTNYIKRMYIKEYFDYVHEGIDDGSICKKEIHITEKMYIIRMAISSIYSGSSDMFLRIVNLIDIFTENNILLRCSIDNKDILTDFLNYNDISKCHVNSHDYDKCVAVKKTIISYDNTNGLNNVIKWIYDFNIKLYEDNVKVNGKISYSYGILWFTENKTFYAKLYRTK